jgi:hypothetical protein
MLYALLITHYLPHLSPRTAVYVACPPPSTIRFVAVM